MRVMVFVKATGNSEAGIAPTPETLAIFEAMDRYNNALVEAGIFVAAAGLKPSAEGARIRFDRDERTVISGPFTPPGELVAGFWIWDVKDMAEAIAWAKRCPNPMPVPSELEIRPYYEDDDLADFVPEADRAAPHEGDRGARHIT